MKFNEKLTMLRKERGMNMTEFANLLGTSKQVIARYEKGENTPKITTVDHYAKVLGVSLQYLVNEDCTDRNATSTPKTATSSKLIDEIAALLEDADEQTQASVLEFAKFKLLNRKGH
jgi:transcriptional regulator with XRE-family HTH domain